MLTSNYILDILDLGLDGSDSENLLREQIRFLSISELEHTGVGLFVYFKSEDLIEQFRADVNDERLDGVQINSPENKIQAEGIIHIGNGIISSLEIFNFCGEDYPTIEPSTYELSQKWVDHGNGRVIIRS